MSGMLGTVSGLETRTIVGEALQGTLYDLMALSQLVKQSRWSVIGPSFHSLHIYLDRFSVLLTEKIDEIADSMVALGIPPFGQPKETSTRTLIQPVPNGFLRDGQVVGLIDDRVTAFVRYSQGRQALIDDTDIMSADMLRNLSFTLTAFVRSMPSVAKLAA